ncbi:MAG: D-alanine--D-alanine ligase [Candidatus Margulisbacteria bacterium]|nr:D-alanine--D-alanine ligase [Candidatus Margulisiibacteriota bacterium]
MNKKIKKIGVLSGGFSSEREVSLRSGNNVSKALQELGYDVIRIDPRQDQIPSDIDFAFIALHGRGGEDGSIQGVLEWLKIPYSGSGICASALACNKVLTKKVLIYHNLPTAPFIELNNVEDLDLVTKFPQIIKPTLEGSSIGVAIIEDKKQLLTEYKQLSKDYTQIFVEQYITGRELTVSILGDEIFPILELVPKKRFYDYEAKYTKGLTDFILPAHLTEKIEKNIRDIALEAYRVIGCRGAVRVDMILTNDGTPYILELNTIPGMTDTSDLPAQAKSAGISFPELVQRIIDATFQIY